MNYGDYDFGLPNEMYFKEDRFVLKVIDLVIHGKDKEKWEKKEIFKDDEFFYGTYDYSPVYINYQDKGTEYGFKLITIYLSDLFDNAVVREEYQWKGQLVIKYYKYSEIKNKRF